MDSIDRAIINTMQGKFPICNRPYLQHANLLGIREDELIERLSRLISKGIVNRFAPMFNAEQLGGEVTLAAMSIARDDFEKVTELVNSFPEIAHNYEREHDLNMWFVIASDTPKRIEEVIKVIEDSTGYPVYSMPKLEEFYVGLKLEI